MATDTPDAVIPAFAACTRAHLRAMSRRQLIAYGAWNDHGNGEWDNVDVMDTIATADLRAELIAMWNANSTPAELAAADAATHVDVCTSCGVLVDVDGPADVNASPFDTETLCADCTRTR